MLPKFLWSKLAVQPNEQSLLVASGALVSYARGFGPA
jgi:hypothetical protein